MAKQDENSGSNKAVNSNEQNGTEKIDSIKTEMEADYKARNNDVNSTLDDVQPVRQQYWSSPKYKIL